MGGVAQSSPRKWSYNFRDESPSKFRGVWSTTKNKNETSVSRSDVFANDFLMSNSYSADLPRTTPNVLHSRHKGSLKFNVKRGSRSNFTLRRWKYGKEGYEIINEQSNEENGNSAKHTFLKFHEFCKSNSGDVDYSESERGWNFRDIFDTVEALEKSLSVSRSLEAEQWLRYAKFNARDMIMSEDLKKAHKLNKNMLNLFRQSVTDIRFGNNDTLPESLKRDVQRSWHQKYDALLKKNEQLKKEASATDFIIKDKDKQIQTLQQKLLDLAESQIKCEEITKKIHLKYLHLKNRKKDKEILFRGTIESLQIELRKTKSELNCRKSETTVANRDSLLAREVRRNERLVHENSTLRALLHEARRVCRNSRSTGNVSMSKRL